MSIEIVKIIKTKYYYDRRGYLQKIHFPFKNLIILEKNQKLNIFDHFKK